MHELFLSQFKDWPRQINKFIQENRVFKYYHKRTFKVHKVKPLNTDPHGAKISPSDLTENPFMYSREFSAATLLHGSRASYVRLT